MKLGVFFNGPMLVQFASGFLGFLGCYLEIGWSTPRISQARPAAWGQAGTLKPFDNMSLKSLILPHREEYWTRKFGIFFSSVNNGIHHSLKQNKEQNGFSVHYLKTEFKAERKGGLFKLWKFIARSGFALLFYLCSEIQSSNDWLILLNILLKDVWLVVPLWDIGLHKLQGLGKPLRVRINCVGHSLEDIQVAVVKTDLPQRDLTQREEMQDIFRYHTLIPFGINGDVGYVILWRTHPRTPS